MPPEIPYFHEQYTAPQPRPLFFGGREIVTEEAFAICERHETPPSTFFTRYYSGDWGEYVSDESAFHNDMAVLFKGLIEGNYRVSDTESLRIITDPGHTQTLMKPGSRELIDVVIDVIERGEG